MRDWPSYSVTSRCSALVSISLSLIGRELIIYRMGGWPTPMRHRSAGRWSDHADAADHQRPGSDRWDLFGGFMQRYTSLHRYYSLLMFLVAGTNGVALTGDLFNLYVFMEITAIASYASLHLQVKTRASRRRSSMWCWAGCHLLSS